MIARESFYLLSNFTWIVNMVWLSHWANDLEWKHIKYRIYFKRNDLYLGWEDMDMVQVKFYLDRPQYIETTITLRWVADLAKR